MEPLDPFPWLDAATILALIALNGVFAMSELAIVSARNAKLKAMAEDGKRGASAALRLGRDPGKFLSTVQIGITLIGIIAGAYSGSTLGGPVADRIALWGVDREWSETLGFGIVISLTTYASLVVGELVPKSIAIRLTERASLWTAKPMIFFHYLFYLPLQFLNLSAAVVLRMMGIRESGAHSVHSEDELRMIFEVAKNKNAVIL